MNKEYAYLSGTMATSSVQTSWDLPEDLLAGRLFPSLTAYTQPADIWAASTYG
jgi:hypothetical protein